MPGSAASRVELAPAAESRRCEECGRVLPPTALARRRFCSSRCRVRRWDALNAYQEPTDDRSSRLYNRTLPKHYHSGVLVGHRDNVPWFGKACPPDCPGLLPDETYEPMEEFWRTT